MNELINDKKRREEKRRGRIGLNFYFTDSEEDQKHLTDIDLYRYRQHWSVTRYLKEASREFLSRHLPSGNSQLDLRVFDEKNPIPLSVAAKEKLAPPPPATPNYSTMTIQELEDCLKKRFLPDFDRTAITFLLKKKAEAHLK